MIRNRGLQPVSVKEGTWLVLMFARIRMVINFYIAGLNPPCMALFSARRAARTHSVEGKTVTRKVRAGSASRTNHVRPAGEDEVGGGIQVRL